MEVGRPESMRCDRRRSRPPVRVNVARTRSPSRADRRSEILASARAWEASNRSPRRARRALIERKRIAPHPLSPSPGGRGGTYLWLSCLDEGKVVSVTFPLSRRGLGGRWERGTGGEVYSEHGNEARARAQAQGAGQAR